MVLVYDTTLPHLSTTEKWVVPFSGPVAAGARHGLGWLRTRGVEAARIAGQRFRLRRTPGVSALSRIAR